MNTLSFWRYGAGDPFKEFLIDLYPYESVNRIFSVYPDTTYYYIGKGAEPEIGDFVYFEEDKDSLFIGDSKYYGINSTTWIQVELGIVIDKGAILEDVPFILEVEIPSDNFEFSIKSASSTDTGRIMGVDNSATITWGDGTTDILNESNFPQLGGSFTKIYEEQGYYEIRISGRINLLNFYDGSNSSELTIKKVTQYGDLGGFGYSLYNARNLTNLPQGAITGLSNTKRGTKFNNESNLKGNRTLLYFRNPNSLLELPSNFTEFIKYEDTGDFFSFDNNFDGLSSITSIPEDFLDGLYIEGTTSFLRGAKNLEYLPPNLLNNAYRISTWGYYSMEGAGKNYLGDPTKTLVVPEDFFSKVKLSTSQGLHFANWNIDSVPENIFKNSLSYDEGRLINLNNTFYGCTKLTSLPDNIFKDFQIQSSCSGMIRNTSITHVKSSWFGGTVQNNDLTCESFAEGSLVDTIDEDFFTFLPNVKTLDKAFLNTMLVSFPTNTFRNLPKVTDYEQCFSNTPLASVPTDAFKESTLVVNARFMFSGADLLSIPSGLFDTWTVVETFESTFRGTFISSIPNNLFDNNTEVTNFGSAFYDCRSLTSIPVGLFDNNTEVTTFKQTFYNTDLPSIPSGLFKNNQKVNTFQGVFQNCEELLSVPNDVFKNSQSVDNLSLAFYRCFKLETVPSNMLEDMVNATNFYRIFYDCNKLQNLPQGFFDNNISVTNMQEAFADCHTFTEVNFSLENMTNLEKINGLFRECDGFAEPFILPSDFLPNPNVIDRADYLSVLGDAHLYLEEGMFPEITNIEYGLVSSGGNHSIYTEIPNIFKVNTKTINARGFCQGHDTITGFIYRFWRDSDLNFSNNSDAFIGCVNALNYPEIPISWGGTIESSRLGFWIDTYKYDSVGKMFSTSPTTWLVHDGDEENPDIGDTVYLDYDLSSNIYDGDEKYFAISQDPFNNEQGTHWIQVDDDGLIIDKGVISIETDFIMEIVIPNDGDTFKLEGVANSVWKVQGGQNAVVDWGDGTTSQLDDSNVGNNLFGVEKSYSASGTYQVKISGRLAAVTVRDTGDKITKILQWGDLGLIGYTLKLGNLTELPQGAITGFYGTKRGSGYNNEPTGGTTSVTSQLNLYGTYSIEYLPNNFLEFLKFEDIGYGVFMGVFYQDCYKLKNIPEDFFQGVLVSTGTNYLFQNCYDLEYLPPDLLNNSYGFEQDISRSFMGNAGANYLGDPNKTLVLDENFFSSVNLGNKTKYGFTLAGWNIDNVPKDLLKNSLGSVSNGGDGVLQVYPLFYNCSKLTELPDDLFKDFQIGVEMRSFIRGTSITHVKSSWMGGTVQNNDLPFSEFARGGIVDTIDEDFFDYFPNATDLRLAFENNEIVTFPNNTFRNLPKVTTFAQTFANNPLVSIPQDAFKESVNATTIYQMFAGTDLTSVPSDLFKDFTEVVDASGLFFKCGELSSIPVGLFYDMTKVTTFKQTFYRCYSLTLIPIGYFSYNVNVDTFEGCFEGSGIIQVPDGLFDNAEIATNFKQTFRDCESLDFVPADVFDNNVEALTFSGCFENCDALVGNINFTINRCTKVTDVSRMFYGSANADPAFELTLSFLPIPNVIDRADYFSVLADPHLQLVPGMFENATNIEYALTSSSGNYSVYTEVPNILRDNVNAVNVRGMMQNHETLTGFIYRFWRDPLLNFSQVTGAFSGCINALNYPEVPVEWGGLGSPRLGFWMDINGEPTSADVVNGNENSWLIHDGANEEPEIGDTVYTSYDTNSGTILGANQFYAIKTDKWIQIDPNGVIIDKGDDTTPPGDLEVINFGVAYPIVNGVALACNRSNGVGTVTQQISYREVGTGSFIPGVSTTQRLTIMEQSGLIPGVTYEFQLTLTDDNETALSSVVTSTIQ